MLSSMRRLLCGEKQDLTSMTLSKKKKDSVIVDKKLPRWRFISIYGFNKCEIHSIAKNTELFFQKKNSIKNPNHVSSEIILTKMVSPSVARHQKRNPMRKQMLDGEHRCKTLHSGKHCIYPNQPAERRVPAQEASAAPSRRSILGNETTATLRIHSQPACSAPR